MSPASRPSNSTAIPPPRPAITVSSSLSSTLEPFSHFQDSCEKQIAESEKLRESLETVKDAYAIVYKPIAQKLLNLQKILNDCQNRILDYKSEQLREDELEKKQALILCLEREIASLNRIEPELQQYNWI
ncbi:hypothetical protein EYC80_010760 [Monilinia laxa]|uniref:Uncharacterized protein n=1 Tax=Monilinia laxa TaxID=61186 RepID=A0A5N6JM59_MONLA|nr:hypothetical protein EYC80_010760 [Monilinia laxa]